MNRTAIILLFIANAISGVAQGISMIAIPWYFAQENALIKFGWVYILATVLSLFWVPVSGSIIDKYDRRKIFLVLTAVVGLSLLSIAAFGYWNEGLAWYIVGLVFILTFLNYNIHYPCLYAFVQEITESHKYARMSSLLEVIGQITTITAGAGATLLLEGSENGVMNIFTIPLHIGFDIQAWEIYEIFLLDASTYFVAFIIIFFIRYVSLKERKIETGSIITRIKTGIRYLKTDPPVFWFGVLSYSVFLALLLEGFYLGVSYVNNHLQESGDVYANAKMAYSVGAICVGLSIRYLFKYKSIPFVITVLTLITSLIFLILFATNSVIIMFAMLLLLGIANAGTRIGRITYLFKNVPNQFFGRAGSVFFLWNVIIRIVLMAVFSMAFFQMSNNIIYAYLILSVILFISTALLFLHYKSFDLSLDSD